MNVLKDTEQEFFNRVVQLINDFPYENVYERPSLEDARGLTPLVVKMVRQHTQDLESQYQSGYLDGMDDARGAIKVRQEIYIACHKEDK